MFSRRKLFSDGQFENIFWYIKQTTLSCGYHLNLYFRHTKCQIHSLNIEHFNSEYYTHFFLLSYEHQRGFRNFYSKISSPAEGICWTLSFFSLHTAQYILQSHNSREKCAKFLFSLGDFIVPRVCHPTKLNICRKLRKKKTLSFFSFFEKCYETVFFYSTFFRNYFHNALASEHLTDYFFSGFIPYLLPYSINSSYLRWIRALYSEIINTYHSIFLRGPVLIFFKVREIFKELIFFYFEISCEQRLLYSEISYKIICIASLRIKDYNIGTNHIIKSKKTFQNQFHFVQYMYVCIIL